MLVRAKESYKIWHDHLVTINKVDRYTIGANIDEIFTSLLELIFRAIFGYDNYEKL
ncbi:MAG: hypothetical protein JWL92_151, partial [Candidatus Nomurabacteria bacterium]|nr:hypothetical protein [Candidatus Nomurabacteria bacterium]